MQIIKETKIKCPNCGNEETLEMPEYVCVRTYQCPQCKEVFKPKEGDCCVFCSYAENECPSKQRDKDCGE